MTISAPPSSPVSAAAPTAPSRSPSAIATPIAKPRHSLRDFFRTAYILGTLSFALFLLVVIAGPILFLISRRSDRGRLPRRLTRAVFTRLIRHHCRLCGTPLQLDLSGAGIDWPTLGPCIVVSNHGSSLDALLLMQLPPGIGDGRMWSKAWPFHQPLLGPLMRLSGHLQVENFNLLPDATDSLAHGDSMLVFPESSRSRTGKMKRFHDGPFLLAARTGRPIIPVAIHGSFACFPPNQWWVHRPILRVQALGVLYAEKNHLRAPLLLKRQTHQMISAALHQNKEII